MKISQLKENYAELIDDIQGDLDAEFKMVKEFDQAQADDLIYVLNERYLPAAMDSAAKNIVVLTKLKEQTQNFENRNLIFSSEAEVLIAKLLQDHYYYESKITFPQSNVVIDETAEIAEDVEIGPNTVIGKKVKIQSGTKIGPNNIICDEAKIGENCFLGAANYIGKKVELGNHVKMHSFNCIGTDPFLTSSEYGFVSTAAGLILEDKVEMGSANTVELGLIQPTIVKTGSKLDNRTFIGCETILGPHSFLTAGVKVCHNVVTGHHFVCGGNTTVMPKVNITDNVQVAGISVVDKDIKESGAYGGHPLQTMRDYLKTSMSLSKLANYRKQIQKIIENEK
tara:strand:+ start:1828 stop:2844 length:1017 start_codon:yes stop_codon:yes gene_type:complete